MGGGLGPRPLVVYCKTCGKKLLVRSTSAGKRGKCAACGALVYIPFLSETKPPMPLHAEKMRQAADTDKTTHLEIIGSNRGLLVGGLIVGVVLAAVVGVVGYSLLSGNHADPAGGERELPPLETPALGSQAPAATAPRPETAPAVGITLVNSGAGSLKIDLEHTGSGPRVQRTLKPGEKVTLGLARGTYKAIWGTFGGGFNFTAGRVEVAQPETWTFTYQDASESVAGGWRRRVE